MRSLARDLGIALGSAAHLAELRRTRSGIFSIADTRPLSDVLMALERGEAAGPIGLCAALAAMPEIAADADTERRLRHGDSRALDRRVPPDAKLFKVVADGRLVAVAEATSRVTATIARIFAEL
jgi:tRNA pseudouridine55 synthase